MDTESAWRERYCKDDFTFHDIVAHLQEECFTDDIFEGYENTKPSAGWQCSMNSSPKRTSIMPTYGREIQFLSCHPSRGTKSHNNSWRISSALREAKVNFECHLAPSWNYCIVKVIWALLLRNSGFSINGVIRRLNWESKLQGSCLNFVKPLTVLTVTKFWIYLFHNVMESYSNFFFLRLPIGQYGPVSQLSRSEESCTGPFNWGEAHCAGEKVKRKIGPFLRKSLKNQTRTRTQQKGAQPATATRNPPARLPGARAKEENNHNKQETSQTNLGTP